MSVLRCALSLCLLLSILSGVLAGCTPVQSGPLPGSPHHSLAADPEYADPGPFPSAFRDVVIEHIADIYPGDRVLRNIVVRPPSRGVVPVLEAHMAGFVGLVRMSLKDEEQQAYVPVEYCYFLREGRVLAFADAREAEWCVP